VAGVLCAVLLPATANAAPPDGSDSLGWRGTVTITHDVDQVYPVEGNSSYTTIHDVATISLSGTGAPDEHGSQTGTATGARDSRSGTARYDCGLAEGALADTDAGHGAGPGVLAVVFATAPDGSRLVEISGGHPSTPSADLRGERLHRRRRHRLPVDRHRQLRRAPAPAGGLGRP
jgi:hypothetical protein